VKTSKNRKDWRRRVHEICLNVQLGLNPPKGLFRSGNAGWIYRSETLQLYHMLLNGVPYALYSNAQGGLTSRRFVVL